MDFPKTAQSHFKLFLFLGGGVVVVGGRMESHSKLMFAFEVFFFIHLIQVIFTY